LNGELAGIQWVQQGGFMSLIWRDQMSVGNNVIDSDHRYLFDLINSVEKNLKTGNQNGLSESLNELSKYSEAHFDSEEKIAHAVGYSQATKLKQSHQDLLRKLDQMRTEISGIEYQWTLEKMDKFTQLLRDWIINHVIKEDMLMKPLFQKRSPSFDPRLSYR
jgi:hemerythrin